MIKISASSGDEPSNVIKDDFFSMAFTNSGSKNITSWNSSKCQLLLYDSVSFKYLL